MDETLRRAKISDQTTTRKNRTTTKSIFQTQARAAAHTSKNLQSAIAKAADRLKQMGTDAVLEKTMQLSEDISRVPDVTELNLSTKV